MRLLLYLILLFVPAYGFSQAVELVAPRYHGVSCLDLSLDGKFLISGSNDNTVFLREASTGNFLREFEVEPMFSDLKFLADNRHFIVLNGNGIEIRDIGNPELRQFIKGEFYQHEIIANPQRNEFLAIDKSALFLFAETKGVFKLIKTLPGGRQTRYCSYSQNGQKLVIQDSSVRLYDFPTGKFTPIELQTIPSDSIRSLALHKNNSTLAIGLKNGGLQFVELTRGSISDSLNLYQTYWSGRYGKGIIRDSMQVRYPVSRLAFTESGYLIAYYTYSDPWNKSQFLDPDELDLMWDNLEKELEGRRTSPSQLLVLWDLGLGKPRILEQSDCDPFAVSSNQVVTQTGIQDFLTGEKKLYERLNSSINQAKFAADGGKLLVDANDKTWILNLSTGTTKMLEYVLRSQNLSTHKNFIGVESDYYKRKLSLLDLDLDKLGIQFDGIDFRIHLNPVKTQLGFLTDKGLSILDFSNNTILFRDSTYNHYPGSYSFSDDGNFLIEQTQLHDVSGHWSPQRFYSTRDFSLLDTLSGDHTDILGVITPLHRLIYTDYSNNNLMIVRDFLSHENIDSTEIDNQVTSLDVSQDQKSWATGFSNGEIQIRDSRTLKVLKTISAHPGTVESIEFSPGDRFLISAGRNAVKIWDLKTSENVASILFYEKDWVVVNRDNLFDGSSGGLARLFFINGLQTIELNQLKTRYYEPGLLKKIINGEKLRNVMGFNKVELPPEIRVHPVDKNGNLPIEVVNRGGGIGEVSLYVNGKEVAKDLRKPGAESKAASLSFSIPISSDKNLVPGTENFLAVKAWNAGQWIESRGSIVKYTPTSRAEIKPAIHILVCGVSDYTRDEIDLKFAAKDAEEMSRALELGARRLFGTEKSYVYTLTTSRKADRYPTKANILKTFGEISASASSTDVFVVYLSGHGINLGGSDGDFHYLTQDAYTANPAAYNDPGIKQQTTLSSQELVELFKKVPALKQVLIIDACASGKVVDNLMAKRDIESGTLRALDRMKDRTGMHIITGCTADAVSYEASRYGQGVLTYSLLEGLRGLALREEKFVDVNQLFQFARDRVPKLAAGIGGIQTPQVFSPNGSESFDFGELTVEDKRQIPISASRPVYIRSNFIDEQKLRDGLGLGKKMDELLNDVAARGDASPFLFVDVSEYPDGCQLSGLYKQTPEKITLRLNRTCEGKETSHSVEAATEKELMEKILELLGK